MTRDHTDEIPDIPADLADAVRHAAAVVPAGRHSMSAVHHRRRLHQRRRTAAVAGVATVAVAAGAAGVAGVPALFRSSGPPAGPAASATASRTAAPAQRLLITGGYFVMQGPNGGAGVTGPPGVLEVDAGGTVVAHPVTGMDSADWTVALPDGRLVMLGPRDLTPGVRREDGPDVADLQYVLTVGTYSADVRVRGEQVQLIGATAEGAYLLRNRRRLVLHDFGTGTERPLDAATATMAAAGDPVHMFQSLVQDRFLVFHTVGGGQRIHVVDIASGAETVLPIALDTPYFHVEGTRLSPDGRTVAVVVAVSTGAAPRFRVLSLDVATGRVLRTQDLAATAERSKSQGVLGLAFTDNHSVRVAWYAYPPDANRVYDIAELLKVSTVTV